jgi:hypothetical protein
MRRRLAARLLDAVIVQIPASVVAIVLVLVLAASSEPTSSPAGVLLGIGGIFMALWLCLCAYEIVMIAVRGGTVGKLLLRITIVPVDTHVRYATHPHVPPAQATGPTAPRHVHGMWDAGQTVPVPPDRGVGWARSLTRWATWYLPGFVLPFWPLLCWLSPVFDSPPPSQPQTPALRGWHDKAAATVVIDAR